MNSALSCYAMVMMLTSLNLTQLHIPHFSYTYMSAHVHNLLCSLVELDSVSAQAGFPQWGLSQEGSPARVVCSTQLDFFQYHGDLFFDVEVEDLTAQVHVNMTSSNDCLVDLAEIVDCGGSVSVKDMHVEPPNALVHVLLERVKSFMEDKAEAYMCGVVLPKFRDALTNHTDAPLQPSPSLLPGAVALEDVPLFRALSEMLFPKQRIYAYIVDETTIRVRFDVGRMIHYSLGPKMFSVWTPVREAEALLFGGPSPFPLEEHVSWYLDGMVALERLAVDVGHEVNVYVSFNDLQCAEGTYSCSIAAVDGVVVSNIVVSAEGTYTLMFNKYVSPLLSKHITALITQHTNRTGTTRFVIPMKKKATIKAGPGRPWVLCYVLLSLVLTGAIVGHNLLLHTRSDDTAVRDMTGSVLSVLYVAAEDVLVCLGVFLLTGCFLYSNLTTAGKVTIGKNMDVYSFSLSSTVSDLWQAGLKPLSVFVLLFSGVYPYFKLLSILYFTVIAHSPDALILRFIDYFGKFSLIDTFVMLIMVGGLEIYGVADVIIGSSFYIFLVATLGSMLLGNYATALWRRGTSVRAFYEEATAGVTATSQDESAAALLGNVTDDASLTTVIHENPEDVGTDTCVQNLSAMALLPILVVLLTVPAFYTHCLRYTVGGVARLITGEVTGYSITELANSAGWLCYCVTLVTIGIAPFFYSFFHKQASWLASWCAADVFIVACVAGLLQLEQFIQFVLGDGMEPVYTAHCTLLWPLFLLGIAAVIVWGVALSDIQRACKGLI